MRDHTDAQLWRVPVESWLDKLGLDSDGAVEPYLVASNLIKLIADEAEVAQLKTEIPHPPPGVAAYMVPRTYIYIRLRGIKQSRLAIIAALVAAAASHSPPISVATSAATAVLANLRRLSEPQAEMLRRLQRLTNGQMYTTRVTEQSLLAAWPRDDDLDPREILADLKEMGVLEEAAGLWRAAL